jgi:hypothetical protein
MRLRPLLTCLLLLALSVTPVRSEEPAQPDPESAEALTTLQQQMARPDLTAEQLEAAELHARFVVEQGSVQPAAASWRLLLARVLARRAGAQGESEEEARRALRTEAARLFSGALAPGESAPMAEATDNLARLRELSPTWPLAEIKFLPTDWPDGDLLNTIAEITGGAPLTPGDPRLLKAIELWHSQLEQFSVDNALDTPADCRRLADHYRIGAAVMAFEELTIPAGDPRLKERARWRAQLLARSFACAAYPAGQLELWLEQTGTPEWALRTQLEWGNGDGPDTPERSLLHAYAGLLHGEMQPAADSLPGAVAWREARRLLEELYTRQVGATQMHDRVPLLVIARLRALTGDTDGVLDLLPLLETRGESGIENLRLPRRHSAAFAAEVAALLKMIRGSSPAAKAYAELEEWMQHGKGKPLPRVAAELLTQPGLAAKWAYANILAGHPEAVPVILDAVKAESASLPVLRPELFARAAQGMTVPLYQRAQRALANGHPQTFTDQELAAQKQAAKAAADVLGRVYGTAEAEQIGGLEQLAFQFYYACGDLERLKTCAWARQPPGSLECGAVLVEEAALKGIEAFKNKDWDRLEAHWRESAALLERWSCPDTGLEYYHVLRACIAINRSKSSAEVSDRMYVAIRNSKSPDRIWEYRQLVANYEDSE